MSSQTFQEKGGISASTTLQKHNTHKTLAITLHWLCLRARVCSISLPQTTLELFPITLSQLFWNCCVCKC